MEERRDGRKRRIEIQSIALNDTVNTKVSLCGR